MRSLNEGRFDDVLRQVPDSVLADPSTVVEKKIVGIAHYQKKNFSLADSLLNAYVRIVPDDDQAMYYLAATSDSLNDDAMAIQWYSRYAAATTVRELGVAATMRSKELLARRMRQDAHKALFYEASITPASLDANAMAVLSFENNGADRTLDPLGRGIAEMVMTDLSKVRVLKIVERLRLQAVLEELQFGETDLAAPGSAPRIGKLVGAHRVVKGSFAATADGMIHIDASVTTTTDTNVEAFDSMLGPKENIFRVEKDLVLRLLRSLSIPVSPEEREAILTIPTENFFAFLRYAEGLEHEDKGQFAEAALAFRAALELDPNFNDAQDALEYTEALAPSGGSSAGGDGGGTAVGTQGVGANLPQVIGGIGPGTGNDAIKDAIERAGIIQGHTGGFTPLLPVYAKQKLAAPPPPPAH